MVRLEEFFVGPGETVLSKDEILTEVQVPRPERDSYGAFLKHGPRNAMDIATVNAALMLTMRERTCLDAKIVLGSVAPVPMRARKAEATICGKNVDERAVVGAAEIASGECSPISDVRGSVDYRRAIVKVLVGRLFQKALPPKLLRS
jgi:carbon-monoxide dehydrogenase medium subunit